MHGTERVQITPAGRAGAASGESGGEVVFHNTFNISGAGDPRAVGEAVLAAWEDNLSQSRTRARKILGLT
jgi:hypothetical protein